MIQSMTDYEKEIINIKAEMTNFRKDISAMKQAIESLKALVTTLENGRIQHESRLARVEDRIQDFSLGDIAQIKDALGILGESCGQMQGVLSHFKDALRFIDF